MESLHPMVVHFPIALLLTALLIETPALILRKISWHTVSLWTCGLGTLGAAAAVLTGRQAMGAAKHSFEIGEIMELHEHLGYVILALASLVTIWRLVKKDSLSIRARWLAWSVLAVACGTLTFSANLGGRMVYEFGVGGSFGRSVGGIEIVQ